MNVGTLRLDAGFVDYAIVALYFVIVAALLPLTVIGLRRVGGWSGLTAKVAAGPGGAGQLSSWPGNELTGFESGFLSAFGIVFGLGFVLAFGYWTTNFVEVQRALAAKSLSAARRTPIIAAFPKMFIPFVVVLPGMIAAVLVPQLADYKAGRAVSDPNVTYSNALLYLMKEVLPTGLLGLAITGLAASFMAGMAANVSAFNTVFSYDLWQRYIRRDRSDRHYLRVGQLATAGAVAVGASFIASCYNNVMTYLQTLFAFFNAPLFATFLLGMLWKRMTPAAGWAGLVAGTLAALGLWASFEIGVFTLASQGPNFLEAGLAFAADVVVSVAVSAATRPKPAEELVGLVYGSASREGAEEEELAWWQRPTRLALAALVLVVVLNVVFH